MFLVCEQVWFVVILKALLIEAKPYKDEHILFKLYGINYMVQNTGYDYLVQFCKICFFMYIFMNGLHYFVNLFAHFYIHQAKLLLHLYCFLFYGFSRCFFPPRLWHFCISKVVPVLISSCIWECVLVMKIVIVRNCMYFSEFLICEFMSCPADCVLFGGGFLVL